MTADSTRSNRNYTRAHDQDADASTGRRTRIQGQSAEDLLPLVYDELRRLAALRMAQENGKLTLQPTALVHEAYLRLLGPEDEDKPMWDGRAHFFAAAAEALRRILIERARKRLALRHGGGRRQVPLNDDAQIDVEDPEGLLELHEAFTRFEEIDPQKAELVKLRYFAGLSEELAAETLGISRATASRHWAYARAWLCDEILRSKRAEES